MSEIKGGGPAFPVSTSGLGDGHQDSASTWRFPGMTLRDYFAAKAMAELNWLPDLVDGSAALTYRIADAMLKARAR